MVFQACDQDPAGSDDTDTDTVTDDPVAETVQIGDQIWMTANLEVTRYRNGDLISNFTDRARLDTTTAGAYTAFNMADSNVATYGYLYNWHAINDSRNIAPEGWHVPTDEEWQTLEIFLGMSPSDADSLRWRGSDEGHRLKLKAGWDGNGNGSNETGFSAVPGGAYFRGAYGGLGTAALFWTATEADSGFSGAFARVLASNNPDIFRYRYSLQDGFSIRCIKD